MSDLYDSDILEWSERQAALLRRRAANELDWDNIAEEIEAVGRNERRAFASHVVQALLHDLKAEAWPLSPNVPHWRAEARLQRQQARDAYTPSMRQYVEIAKLYARALDGLPETMEGQLPLPLDPVCPVTLDELLSEA